MKIFDIMNNFIKKNKGLSSLYIISVIVAYTIKDVVIPDIFGKIFEQKNNNLGIHFPNRCFNTKNIWR